MAKKPGFSMPSPKLSSRSNWRDAEHEDSPMAKKRQAKASKVVSKVERAKAIADQAVTLAEYAARALVAAEALWVKGKPVEGLSLKKDDRSTLAMLPSLSAKHKKNLTKPDADFTVAEVAGIIMAVAEAFIDAEPKQQIGLLLVAKKLMDCLQQNIVEPVEPAKGKKAKAGLLYQFKITLLESRPPIWRRIQVNDCTLDTFHEHIQTAMGWTNSHPHHFRVGKQLYGDPELMQENFAEMNYKDSTRTKLSAILPNTGKRFQFVYEYDFGDSWDHDVLFEGCVAAESRCQYPLCLEGKRACPPEDVGGMLGYAEFVETIENPHDEQHDEMLKWVGGKFDPEAFDAKRATKAMKKGLPDWRKEEWI
jgi:hypothetical protein